jgi:hypothetical protein
VGKVSEALEGKGTKEKGKDQEEDIKEPVGVVEKLDIRRVRGSVDGGWKR